MRLSRIVGRDRGPRPITGSGPVLTLGHKQLRDETNRRLQPADLQHERHLPSGLTATTGSGEPRYGPPRRSANQLSARSPLGTTAESGAPSR